MSDTFIVRYFDPVRGVVETRVDAVDEQAAVGHAGVASTQVLSVTVAAAAARMGAGRAHRFPLRLFAQELAVLLAAGIPLLEALAALSEKESSPRTEAAMRLVMQLLRDGQTLSAALAACPEFFDPLFVAMIESSERTGQVERALREHAAYLAWVDQLRARLLAACIYPAALLAAGFAVTAFLLLFVVPRFAGVLESVGGQQPASSRVLVAVGRACGDHPWASVAVMLVFASLPVLAWRSRRLRDALARRVDRLPLVGRRLRVLALARLYRTAGMLVAAGVPVTTALANSVNVTSVRLRGALEAAIRDVREGDRVSAALDRHGLTTPVSLRMLRVGERSGETAAMLSQAAAFYDDELARLTELVTKLINPVLMLVMGTIIGTVVVLMYLPIFELAEQVQ
jgi:general secretion pathway protein F